jgi:hypothetical protein
MKTTKTSVWIGGDLADIRTHVTEVGCVDWIHLAYWRAHVSTVINCRVLSGDKFFLSCELLLTS